MPHYTVEPAQPHAHIFRVRLSLAQPQAQQRLSLPVWIPGSYMVREFGRHILSLRARQGRRVVAVQQLDKTTWLAQCSGSAALEVDCEVYAFDTSVRAAFLDAERGFFNGTSLLLRCEGFEDQPHQLRIAGLPARWQLATALEPGARRGEYSAASYDELVDHPVELGRFWRGRFEVRGVPHEFVVAGALPGFDGERLLADTRRICEQQIAFWHGPRGKPPMARYVFMLNAVEDGYGGLEHRASTALIAARRDLPKAGLGAPNDGYVKLLGLISHEYFHTWNVKRLKPRELAQIDYTRENYTPLLWFFEGFTSYYDDLLLLRSGLIDAPRYLQLLAKAVSGVLATPGRQRQSVAEASFDAWVKYYRSDENTPNATVSYYLKGSLVALCLDLSLRAGAGPSQGATLDAVMRALWQRSGGGPIGEDDVAAVLQQLGGRSFAAELQAWVHGRGELPLQPLLQAAGVQWREDPPSLADTLGLRLAEGAVSGCRVKTVLAGSAAESAGVAAGDELLAVDGWRIRRLEDARAWLAPGRAFELLLVRDQRITRLKLKPPAAGGGAAPQVQLALQDAPAAAALALRRAWLGR